MYENPPELPVTNESRDLPERPGDPTLDSATDFNLLESLIRGESGSRAWEHFVVKYRRILGRWCLRWGASRHELDDVFQETLIQVHQSLSGYEKQPGKHFRSWLKTLAYRCWLQLLQKKNADRGLFAEDFDRTSHDDYFSTAARDELIRHFDRIAEQEILEFACSRVRSGVEPQTWDCFRMTYFDQLPGEDVASSLGVSLNTVYLANSRCRRLLRQEIDRLDPPSA